MAAQQSAQSFGIFLTLKLLCPSILVAGTDFTDGRRGAVRWEVRSEVVWLTSCTEFTVYLFIHFLLLNQSGKWVTDPLTCKLFHSSAIVKQQQRPKSTAMFNLEQQLMITFYYSLIWQWFSIIWSLKCQKKVKNVHGDAFRCLVLSVQTPKIFSLMWQ